MEQKKRCICTFKNGYMGDIARYRRDPACPIHGEQSAPEAPKCTCKLDDRGDEMDDHDCPYHNPKPKPEAEKPKGVTEKINDFIAKEGGDIVRDALNVALARLEMMTHDRDWWKAEWEKEVRKDGINDA